MLTKDLELLFQYEVIARCLDVFEDNLTEIVSKEAALVSTPALESVQSELYGITNYITHLLKRAKKNNFE